MKKLYIEKEDIIESYIDSTGAWQMKVSMSKWKNIWRMMAIEKIWDIKKKK